VCLTDADVEKTERVKKASLADAAEDLLDAFGQEHEIERDAGIDDQVFDLWSRTLLEQNVSIRVK
jgi:hypothetical protein